MVLLLAQTARVPPCKPRIHRLEAQIVLLDLRDQNLRLLRQRALEASGFEKISWEPLAADGAPPDPEESYMEIVGVFTARLA